MLARVALALRDAERRDEMRRAAAEGGAAPAAAREGPLVSEVT